LKNRLLNIYSFGIFAFLYLPILILVIFSFNQDKFNSSWGGFSTEWYIKLLNNSELLESFQVSFTIALFSAFISTIIGTLAAYGFYKKSFFGTSKIKTLVNLPIITPDIILGLGLLIFFVSINFTLGYYSILLAHITFNISYTTLIVLTRFSNFNSNIENAAKDLGASNFKSFVFIILPNIFPGILVSFLIAFTLSWDDFIISFFTSGVGTTTLPVRVYSMIKMGVNPQINAISTITLVITIITILIASKFQNISKIINSKSL